MLELTQQLRKVGLRISEDGIEQLLRDQLSSEALLKKLVQLESHERDTRNLQTRTKTAALGKFKPIVDFDWEHPKVIDKVLVQKLLGLSFMKVSTAENILLRGPSGVGKTTIAKNIGFAALQAGYTVRFTTLIDALADLLRQESLPAVERRMKRYTQPDLLILDELGYVTCEEKAVKLFFNIISRRHEARSVIITTNISYKDWGNIFPNAPCLGALVDRFAEHCHVVDIEAESYRLRSAKPKIRKTPRAIA